MFCMDKLNDKYKNDMFNNWLDKYIEPNKRNKDVVLEMIGEIIYMLDVNGYKIEKTKQFKNEIASYIYSESV